MNNDLPEARATIGQKECLVFIIIVIINSLFVVGYSKASSVLTYLGLFVLVLAMMLLSIEHALLLFVSLIPNIRIIKIAGFENALLSYAFLLVEAKFFIFRNRHSLMFPKALLALLVSCLLSILANYDYAILSSLVRFVILLLFLYNWFKDPTNSQHREMSGI